MHRWTPPLGRDGARDVRAAEKPGRHRRRVHRARSLVTRALVLGGAGFVGVAACKELMRRGVETIAAGRKERPYGTFTSYVAFDRTQDDQLERALRQVEPDVVLDLACYQPGEARSVARLFSGARDVLDSTGLYPKLDGKCARVDHFVPLLGAPPPEPDNTNGT